MAQRKSKTRDTGHRVFISHAQTELGLARDLADALRKASFEPWLFEESVGKGDNVAKKAGQALDDSDAIVLLLSKSALRSPWVKWEWDFAIGSRRHAGRVLPVLTAGTELESVPWILKHMRHVRVGTDRKRAARAIVNALRKLPKTG